MLPRISVLFLVLGASIASAPQSQTVLQSNGNPTPIFKAKAQLVLVDVVVTNGKGDPVSGLKKQEFEVMEDGKVQTIAIFEEHNGAPPEQIKLPPMPPNVYTNFPVVQAADSVNVILLDALNTPASDQTYVHSEMLKYVKKLSPQTRVVVFTLGSRLRMLQGVTTDSRQLLAVLNSTKAGPSPSPLRASTVETDANQSRADFLAAESMGSASSADQTSAQSAVDPVSATKQFLSDTANFQTRMRTQMTLDAMQQLARYLADIPGRKNVIWLSGSFPAGILADPDAVDPFSGAANFQEEIRRTTDLLTTAQVALYPIAAEGMTSDVAFQVDNRQIGEKRGSVAAMDTMQQSQVAARDLDFSHASMLQLAKETGGQAFFNANGLNDAFARVVNNGSRYYSLAYSPTNPAMDGKYRHILIKRASGKETLSYRRGYFADDLHTILASGQKPNYDPLLPLIGRNLPDYAQIVYKILVQPTEPQPAADAPHIGSNKDLKGPFTRYAIDFAVSVDDLQTTSATDGTHQGSIEVMLVAYDAEGKPLNQVASRSEIRIPAKDFANVRKGGLQIHKEIDMPQGSAFLRTGIYDFNAATAGTLGVPLFDTAAGAAK